MNNLQLLKAANDLAFDTITQTGIQVDAATAAKAAELDLTDAQYAGFKNAVNAARQTYARAVQQDTQIQRVAGVVPGTPPALTAAQMQAEGDNLSTVRKITQQPGSPAIVIRSS